MPRSTEPLFKTARARENMRKRIVSLIEAGISQRSAAQTLKVSLGYVQRTLKHEVRA